MAQKLKLEYSFNKTIYDIILDLRKFGELHPNMKVVNVLSAPAPNCVEYEVFEEVTLFGLMKMKPYYKAKVIEIEKGKHIQYLSEVKKNIFLTIDFIFIESGTKIIEEVEVKGNFLIASVLINTIKKAHTAIFERFK